MAAFSRMATQHQAAVASICTLLFVSSPSTLSSWPNTAHAFSQHSLTSGGCGPPSVSVAKFGSLPPSPSYLLTSTPALANGYCRLNELRKESSLALQRGGDRTFMFNGLNQNNNLFQHQTLSILHSKRSNRHDIDLTALPSDSSDEEVPEESSSVTAESSSLKQDIQSIFTLVGVQSLLIPISVVIARYLNIPNNGLGVGFEWTSYAATQGLQWTIPLFAVAGIMRLIEPYSPALQDVTKATQRSVLAVMGKERRPVFALFVSILLGAAAGWGEEWLFRGVFQTVLSDKFSSNIALAISGIVFGLLHAVTPVYALLAGAASVFFGYLYNISGNLAVPMICHAVYDVGALMWAHWSVTELSSKEQDDILESGPGAPIMDAGVLKD